MKVIKITKTYRNAKVEHLLVTDEEDDDNIKDAAEEWCEYEGGGMSNGYSFRWNEVKDKKIIKQRISEEIDKTLKGIVYQTTLISKYNEFLKTL